MTTIAGSAQATDTTETLGRVALATQGMLYLVVGGLAMSLATGDHGAEASQTGAIESVARQPYGRALMVVVLAGLLAYAAWRLLLAVRGEPGPDDDGQSVVKRLANVGRAAIYLSLSYAAFKLLTNSYEDNGNSENESTARVLDWPAGKWLVIGVGLAVIAAGLWNISKVATAVFLDDLDLSTLRDPWPRVVGVAGRVGYLARGVAFGLVGWFLVEAGWQHDPSETRGLDASLRALLERSHGPWMLRGLAVGLFLFGSFRMMDARFRKPAEIVHS